MEQSYIKNMRLFPTKTENSEILGRISASAGKQLYHQVIDRTKRCPSFFENMILDVLRLNC